MFFVRDDERQEDVQRIYVNSGKPPYPTSRLRITHCLPVADDQVDSDHIKEKYTYVYKYAFGWSNQQLVVT